MKTSDLKTYLEDLRDKGMCVNTFIPFNEGNVIKVLREFRCQRCGYCCTQLSLITMFPHEVREIARFRGLTVKRFKWQYTIRKDGVHHLPYPCPFYDNGCKIYRVRPATCAQYPIREMERDEKKYIGLASTCPAVEEICLKILGHQLEALKKNL